MTCLLCIAVGAVGTLTVSFIIGVVIGKCISLGADYANDRSDAAWADLADKDDQ